MVGKAKPMGRPLKLLPLFTLMLVCSAVAAYAITWTDPTFPFYASTTDHGAIYFASSFTADSGNWTAGLLMFYNMSYAGSTTFTSIGYAAQNATTLTLLEASPTSHMLMSTEGSGALRNVTLYLPVSTVVNVTNVDAYTWNNATNLLEITTSLGPALVRVNFVAGSGLPVEFIIPAWFIDLGGAYFGVADFFTNLTNVMAAFVAWFLTSVGYVISLIFYIMTGIVNIATFVILWFGRGITFAVTLLTAVGNIFDQGYTTVAPYKEVIDLIFSADGLMLAFTIGFASWFASLEARAIRSGGNMMAVMTGDLQTAMWWVDTVWGWSWTVFNFVYGVVMQFVSLLWGLIP